MDSVEETEHSTSVGNNIVKTTPIIRDFSLNPSCSHGPTILFERNGARFFSCSAYRSRKLCQFYMTEEKWTATQERDSEGVGDGGGLSEGSGRKRKCPEDRESGRGQSSKKVKHGEKKLEVNHPLSLPNQRDKGEAQYHFNDVTVKFFMEQLKNLEIDNVLCIGTPSLHQHISKNNGHEINSFLLDIDHRFSKLYKDGFSLYNMCNHHFFHDASKYMDFMQTSRKLAVIVDPPFGVKVELIWHGCLQGVQRDLARLHNTTSDTGNTGLDFDVFWIFPYFMEGHILKCSTDLKMSDFHVEYRNHAKYSGNRSKSKSSPIRIFTTVSLSNLILPKKDYRYCEECQKWVDKQNTHCGSCGTCTTKDGGRTYVHCNKCTRCVKPTWKHCNKCGTCHLMNTPCKNSQLEDGVISNNNKSKNIKLIHSADHVGLRRKPNLHVKHKQKKRNKN